MTGKEREELAKRWTAICKKYSEQPHRRCQQSYNVWMQGYECTGQSCPDTYMGTFTADTFQNACMKAMRANGYSEEAIEEYYNASNNSFWGCSFFEGSKPTSYEKLEREIQELKKEVNKLRGKLRMTKINYDNLPEFPGFTVYDRETGRSLMPKDIDARFDVLDVFGLDEFGNLVVIPYDAEDWRTGMIDVDKEDKYIIQLGSGEYYKW